MQEKRDWRILTHSFGLTAYANNNTPFKKGITKIRAFIAAHQTLCVCLALLYSQCAFGTYAIVGKIGLKSAHPIIFAFLREIISGPILLFAGLYFEGTLPMLSTTQFWKDAWRFALLGVTGIWATQLFFILGLSSSGPIVASMCQPMTPVFTALIAMILGIESASIFKILGICAAALGAGTIVGFDLGGGAKNIGVMYFMCNTMSMSIYLIVQKPVLKKYPKPLTVTGLAYVIGSTIMGITAFTAVGSPSQWQLHLAVFFPLAYTILIATVTTYACLAFANSHLPSSLVAVSNTIQPIVSTSLSIAFLDEHLVSRHIIGGFAILLGLGGISIDKYLDDLSRKKRHAHGAPSRV